jgi:hypothetical protein
MKMDRQNRPNIAYIDYSRNEVKYLVRTDQGWKFAVVESGTDLVMIPSLALDAKDLPHIAYFDETIGAVRVAHPETPAPSRP